MGRCRLRSFGEAMEGKILKALQGPELTSRRFLLADAKVIADAVVRHLRQTPGVGKVEIAGCFRSRRETDGDLNLLVTCRRAGPVYPQDSYKRFLLSFRASISPFPKLSWRRMRSLFEPAEGVIGVVHLATVAATADVPAQRRRAAARLHSRQQKGRRARKSERKCSLLSLIRTILAQTAVSNTRFR